MAYGRNTTSTAVLVANTGVAPIYRDAYISVGGDRGSYNLRNLLPGHQVWDSVKSSSITLDSQLTIDCDHLVPGQKIGYDADIKVEE